MIYYTLYNPAGEKKINYTRNWNMKGFRNILHVYSYIIVLGHHLHLLAIMSVS